MHVLYIASSFDHWNFSADSTPLMINEVRARGGKTWVTTPDQLRTEHEIPFCTCQEISCDDPPTKGVFGANEEKKLDSFQVIHLRTDPPFDMDYYYTTIILDLVKKALVVNNPTAVRSLNEKMAIFHFPHLITDTILTRFPDDCCAFAKKCDGKLIAKQLGDCSSRSIVKLAGSDEEIRQQFSELVKKWEGPIMLQRFLEEVSLGETRLTLINGEIAGWMKKRPKSDSFLASLDFGATVESCELTKRDHQIINEVGPFLQKHGLLLASLDVINGHLSEINITSPGLLKHTNDVMNIKLEAILEDAVEKLVRSRINKS
jgi:glutathione synthase